MPRPRLRSNTQSNAVCVYADCQHTGRYETARLDGSKVTVCAHCHATLKNGKWSA